MDAWDWNRHLLLITIHAGRDVVVLLLENVTQEQFFTRALDFARCPSVVSITKLTQESFDMLLPNFLAAGRFIEGE